MNGIIAFMNSNYKWSDYTLLDSGRGKRLEQWGKYRLIRPDVNAVWQPKLPEQEWKVADAVFMEGEKKWVKQTDIPDKWLIRFKELQLWVKLTPFKHTGVFPEQALQWEWMTQTIAHSPQQLNILNLFGYTGVATLVCAATGAKVTHVDASKPSVTWMRENQEASDLLEKPVRLIVDDVRKFVERELKRRNKYDGILLDPPVFGHGAKGERWHFSRDLPILLRSCQQLLSDNPQFVLMNTYSDSVFANQVRTLMKDAFEDLKGRISTETLSLTDQSGRELKTGIAGKWEK